MKLIHSGKVLKDTDTIESCNIKPSDFLVVMITKAKKEKAVAASAVAAAGESAPADAVSATETTAAATSSTETTTAAPPAAATSTTESTSTENNNNNSTSNNNNNNNNNDEFPSEIMANLRALGFPESDILVCLRASNGNPDVAVEFLMNGIPPGIAAAGGAVGAGGGGASGAASGNNSSTTTSATTSGGGGPLEALRQHPQFNDIRRLVQTNPQMLSAVLQQIGGQQPELLSAINANQAEFLAMMNEPIAEGTGGSGSGGGGGGATSGGAEAAGSPASSGALGAGLGGVPGMEALGNPAQLAAMLQSMPPQEQQAMASMMGMTVDQLQQTAQMISAMPPEQVQQYMNMAMQGAGGMGGMMGAMGGAGGGGGGGGGGAQVLRLSEEEMAAVNRLTEMGFDRAAAAQAYLACDKNEALAANLLMDGGFADFGDDADMGGGGGGGDDDMYD